MVQIVTQPDKGLILSDLDNIRTVEQYRERYNEVVSRLPEVLRGAGLPTNSEYLSGVFSRGMDYIKEQQGKEVEKWLSRSPLSPVSKKRLIQEAIDGLPETLSEKIRQINEELRSACRGYMLDFEPIEGEVEFQDGKIELTEKYTQRAEEIFSHVVTEEEMEDSKRLASIYRDIAQMEMKGYNILSYDTFNTFANKFVTCCGVLADLREKKKGEPVTVEESLLSLFRHKVSQTVVSQFYSKGE